MDLDDPDCVECVLSLDCDDGNPCTNDVCDRGVCRRSPVDDDTPCDDGLYCNGPDRCLFGSCSVHEGDPCADGVACTEDVCDEGNDTCGHPVSTGKCYIGGVCYNDGDANPSDACETCSHVDAPSDWTWTERPWILDICGNAIDEDCDTVIDGCCMGDGTFGSATGTTVGSDPWYMVSADFNEDGIPDLATANRNSSTVSILIGDGSAGKGNGTFTRTPPGDLASAGTPYGLAVADVDGDGYLDLVAANSSGTTSMSVFWGGGDGGFDSRSDVTLSGTPTFPAVGDFDGDGDMDIAVSAYTATVAVILGGGTARTFSAPVYYDVSGQVSGARSIVAGDFNGDDILDLAVAAFTSGAVTILYGNGSDGVGDGTFQAPTSGSTFTACAGPTNITSADLDQDGILDLVLSCMNANRIGVLMGNGSSGRGDGTFGAVATYATGAYPVAVTAADLNSDRVPDLVFAEWGSASVGVMLGQYSGGRPEGTCLDRMAFGAGSNPVAAAVVDSNGDDIPDLAIANIRNDSPGTRIDILFSIGIPDPYPLGTVDNW